MKTNRILTAMLFIGLLFTSFTLFAQEEHPMSPEQKAWMEYMMPGEMHKVLEKSVGKWKTESKFWQKPGTEPMVSEGILEAKMILGGRYLQSTMNAQVMNQPMEGIAIDAYDNALGKFKSIWIDNMGTGIATSVGTYDEATNSITYSGSAVDPISKKKVSFKSIVKFIDDDTQSFEMFMTENGKEFKSFEIIYKRIKDSK